MDNRLVKFCHLVEAKSFTKASRELHISQPALSIALRNLEKDLGTKLINRDKKHFELTEAGKLTYKIAKDMDIQTQNLHKKLLQLSSKKPFVAVGMIDSMADTLFTQKDVFNKLDSMARVSLVIDNSTRLLERVNDGSLDLAIITQQIEPIDSQITAVSIANEPLLLVSHAKLAKGNQKCIKDSQITDFISYDQGSTTERIVQRTLEENGFSIETIFRSSSPDIMLKLLLSKKGRAVLPFIQIKPHLDNHEIVPIKINGSSVINRPICAIYKKNADFSLAQKYITDSLSRILADLEDTTKNY